MSSIDNHSSSTSIETNEVDDEVRLDEQALERITDAIRKKITEGAKETESKSSAFIYRVPNELRKLKKSAYTPCLISIGPLHCRNKHILKLPVQNVKMSCVNSLLREMTETIGVSDGEVQKKCVDEMKASKKKAQACYAEEVKKLDEEMLVIDGCFILELLYRSYIVDSKKRSSHPILGNGQTNAYVQHDLLLLENQLPFFVLNKLFDLTVARIGVNVTLTEYVTSYLEGLWNPEKSETTTPPPNEIVTSGWCNWFSGISRAPPKQPQVPNHKKPPPPMNNDYHHILHILHNHYHCKDAVGVPGIIEFRPCASDLDYAGVKFEVGAEVKFHKPEGLFHKARFQIPILDLYDSTEPFLRNLIAYEQSCPGVPGYFTSYAILMDTLINTPKDVLVLENVGIIRNYLGASEDASHLFNNLCKEVVLVKFHFIETIKDASDYRKRCGRDTMAYLRRKCFANPWTFIAFCAGFITFRISLVKFFRSNFR